MNWAKWKAPLVLIAVVMVFLLTILIMGRGNLILGDESLFLTLNPPVNPSNPSFIDHFFAQFSSWGPVGWGIATWGFIPFALLLFALSFKFSALRPTRFLVLLVVLGLVVGYLGITTVLKHVIERPRPFMTIASNTSDWMSFFYPLETFPYEIFDLGFESFPSGHATAGFIFATPFILIYKSYWVKVPAIVYGILAAYARVYLGVHHPSDILVGSLVGILSVWLFYVLFKKYVIPRAPGLQYEDADS